MCSARVTPAYQSTRYWRVSAPASAHLCELLMRLSLKLIKIAITTNGQDSAVNNHAEKVEVLKNLSVLPLGKSQMLNSDQTITMLKYFPFQ